MIHPDYLTQGLQALARAHQVNPMCGHLGAALVAATFIPEEAPELPDGVWRGMEGQLDQILEGKSVFSPRDNSPIGVRELFAPFAAESPHIDLVPGIADALRGNIDRPRQSGHNVIFASIAIRAFTEHPVWATPSLVDGTRKLIAAFDGAHPGSGYYGKETGRINGNEVQLPDDESFPPYDNLETMAHVVVQELIQHGHEVRSGYGGLWHVINHAAALVELDRYGYGELAVQGLPAHHTHVRLWRALPDLTDERGHETPSKHDPRAAAFWAPTQLVNERAHLTHRVKTLYGFLVLMRLITDETIRANGWQALRCLM